jgi:hypothetical protein
LGLTLYTCDTEGLHRDSARSRGSWYPIVLLLDRDVFPEGLDASHTVSIILAPYVKPSAILCLDISSHPLQVRPSFSSLGPWGWWMTGELSPSGWRFSHGTFPPMMESVEADLKAFVEKAAPVIYEVVLPICLL